MRRRNRGFVLPAVVAFAVIFFLIGLAVLSNAEQEMVQTRISMSKARAFYLAEAGLARLSEERYYPRGRNPNDPVVGSTEKGTYSVEVHTDVTPSYAISTGTCGPIQKRIRTELAFLAPPFEKCVYGLNNAGGNWTFALRGSGTPAWKNGHLVGGADTVRGNIFVDGDARLYEESKVVAAPVPNTYNLNGDVTATGNISVTGSASIAGSRQPGADEASPVDLLAMDYQHNNTHDVATIFQSAGVSSGNLPAGNALRDIFTKNPGDRVAECASTTGNDYFLEPTSGFIPGNQLDAKTSLNLGVDRVYYVDGDVWINSGQTYGFKIQGRVTIVATGNIHISDNMEYKDTDSVVGLVALGKYDESGNLISGGDIYFGDPRYGTLYTGAGLMYAAHDFLYSTDSITRQSAEPQTGFRIFGSFAALNRVSVERNWYTQGSSGTARAATYDPERGVWIDVKAGTVLTATEVTSLRHYQMVVNYDERVRNAGTRPPGLPQGGNRIFAGLSKWQELP